MESAGEAGASTISRWWIAVGFAVVVAAGFVALIVFALTSGGGSQAARRLPPIATPAADAAFVRGDVRQVNGDKVSAGVGQSVRSITVAPSTRVEALLPASPNTIAVGDSVSVGGAPNLVNTVAVKLVVVIPQDQVADANAATPRSKGGFTGWEAYPDQPAPRLVGRVQTIGADGLHVMGTAGAFVLRLDAQSVIRRFTVGGVELVHGGDHVAYAAGSGDAPAALLVMPP